MSKLRPELRSNPSHCGPVVTDATALLMVYQAVSAQPGLLHGRLHERGAHCAIGSFFDVNPKLALYETLIDEVAAVNDSMPALSMRARKVWMLRWLRWKLKQAGMPGFARAGLPQRPRAVKALPPHIEGVIV